jgi:undecaprenyl-diphosphatase
MHLLHCIILSIVQAVTEFLPISSSGHLLFLKGLFANKDIPVIFDIIIHLGSLIAIVTFYYKMIINTLKNSLGEMYLHRTERNNLLFLTYILISTFVTFLLFLFIKGPIEKAYQSPSVLFITYSITSIILFFTVFTEKKHKSEIIKKGIWVAVVVGLFQGLAIMPGISRSGSTIASLLIIGVKREEAVYYSFFLAIPAILGALFIELLEIENFNFVLTYKWTLILSFFISIICSYVFLKLLTLVIRNGKFWLFSFYTFFMAVLSFILFK